MSAKFLILLILTATFLACNPENMPQNMQTSDNEIVRLGFPVPRGELLEGEKLGLAQNVCSALRENWQTIGSRSGGFFRYRILDRGCVSPDKTQEVAMKLNYDSFTIQGNYTGPFFKNLETHEKGALAGLCQKVLSNTATGNTWSSGPRKFKYEFSSIIKDQAIVRIITGKNRSATDTNFITDEIQEWVVNINPYGDDYGMLKRQMRRSICTNSTIENILAQEFLGYQ